MAQWIKSDINIDFVGRRKKFWSLSAAVVVLSIVMLPVNYFVRGAVLNYGTDFRGGSQIQIEFKKGIATSKVRAALDKAGYKKAEVVKMQGDNKNLFLLRLTEVSAFTKAEQATAKKAVERLFPGALKKFDYKAGGDKLYIVFSEKVKVEVKDKGDNVVKSLKEGLAKAKIAVQQVQLFGRADDRTFEIQLGGLAVELRAKFNKTLGKGAVIDIPQAESVGAKMGQQLRNDGIKSVMYALLLMLVYIGLRFDFRYAPGAVVALAHDVIITIGIFAITYVEFSLPVVAALLTISGYSINDTIVVYDRIRENTARMRDRKFPLVVNASINETLSRTLLTSLTTLFTCVSIWVMGTGVLETFAMALTIGVIVGTYSSVFVASPLVVLLNERFAAAKRKTGRAR